MSQPWIKMWTEARNDRKLDLLSDAQHRVWHNLLLYSAEQEARGTFRDSGVLAIEVARGDQALLQETIEKCAALQMLVADGEGGYVFRAFEARNAGKPSDTPEAVRERKRRQREREAAQRELSRSKPSPSHPGHDASRPVTRDCHEEGEVEGEGEVEEDTPQTPLEEPRVGNIVEVSKAFERYTGSTAPNMLALCADHPTDRLIEAIRLAADAGKPNVSYIRGVARRLASEGWSPQDADSSSIVWEGTVIDLSRYGEPGVDR